MYEFHCDYIKNKYVANSKLLLIDIDSLMCEDLLKDFSKDEETFDFSNYSTESKYYDNWNKLVVGKMKDETAAVAI